MVTGCGVGVVAAVVVVGIVVVVDKVVAGLEVVEGLEVVVKCDDGGVEVARRKDRLKERNLSINGWQSEEV